MEKKIPLGIKLVSILFGINGFGAIIISICFLFYTLIRWHRLWDDLIFFLLLGILLASLSIGLFKLKNWARITTMLLFFINAITIGINALKTFFRGEIGITFFFVLNVILAIWIFRYLLNEKNKILFSSSSGQLDSSIINDEALRKTETYESKVKCTNCGTENLIDSIYCISCGVRVSSGKEIIGTKEQESLKCSSCGLEISRSVKFCKYCGTKIEVTGIDKKEDILPKCPKCKSIISSTAKFCKFCGTKLKED